MNWSLEKRLHKDSVYSLDACLVETVKINDIKFLDLSGDNVILGVKLRQDVAVWDQLVVRASQTFQRNFLELGTGPTEMIKGVSYP